VGLLCDLGTRLVCYDENFKIKWSEDYPGLDLEEQELDPDLIYSTLSEMTVQHDGVAIIAKNENYTKVRDLRFSFDGKKIGEEILDWEKKPFSKLKERAIQFYPLSDGRKLFIDPFQPPADNQNNHIVMYLEEKGELTEFDDFAIPYFLPDYDFPVTPTEDGGFFIAYYGRFFDDNAVETTHYYVLTKYNAQGQTEFQRVYRTGQHPVPLKTGLIVLNQEEVDGY